VPATNPPPDVGVIIPAKHTNCSGLAGTVGAEESEYLALFFTEKVILFTATKAPNFFFQIRHGNGIRSESIMCQISITSLMRFNNCFFPEF